VCDMALGQSDFYREQACMLTATLGLRAAERI
jgi:hypothetical protein